MPVSVTSAEKNINLFVEYQCPQCGAPAVLEETDRLFRCEYCRVKSYLVAGDILRYTLPHHAPTDKHLLYFPYWRFKGLHFTSSPEGIRSQLVDFSHRALDLPYFPVSVGLRSQTLKLRFCGPEAEGSFLKPDLPFERALAGFERRLNNTLSETLFHKSHIGETLSLIYAPFYVEDRLFDGVLNEPLSTLLPDEFRPPPAEQNRQSWQMKFLATLCPDCGWDMEAARNSLVLVCKNCHSVWRPTGNKMKKIKFSVVSAQSDNDLYLPFWRIRAEVSGIELASYADMVRIANLPKVVRPEWHDTPLYFWSPAFKVHPRTFIRLRRHLSLSQPQEDLSAQLPDAAMHAVSLSVNEALESLKITLASFMKPATALLPRLPEIHIKPLSLRLVFVPFGQRSHEWVQPRLHLTINKNQLALGENL